MHLADRFISSFDSILLALIVAWIVALIGALT
jgi:hypothetical protein